MLEPVKRAIERYKSIFRRADLSPLALSGAYSLSPDGSKLAFHSAYRQWPVDGAICSRCSRATTATLSRCNTCWTHERRRWPRYSLNIPVRVWKSTAAQLAIVNGFASQLSAGGMAICAPIAIAVGDEIALEFEFPVSSEPMRLTAVVRNFQGKIHGVEFVPKTGAEKRALDELRSKLRSAFPSPPQPHTGCQGKLHTKWCLCNLTGSSGRANPIPTNG